MKTITKDNVSDYVQNLIDLTEKIEAHKITILTGSNGAGKSFARKLIGAKMPSRKGTELTVASTCMERRAGLNMHGAMAAFLQDADWNPTSLETLKLIDGVLSQENRYVVIDEPEIGMGEEMVLGLVEHLNAKLKEPNNGVLIITHSRLIVEHLEHDLFLNLDGLTYSEWLNRKVVPFSVKELEEKSSLIFREIQDRINKAEKNQRK
jgi:ABC-type Mn2+/Zn2+ transport system ATPase subunit